jgi:hypothetical protein
VDSCLCISGQEANIMRAVFPRLKVRVLKYGLPLEDHPFLPAPAVPFTLGFIGNYRHTPNRDALTWLVKELYPALRARLPESRLVLAGHQLPDGIAGPGVSA